MSLAPRQLFWPPSRKDPLGEISKAFDFGPPAAVVHRVCPRKSLVVANNPADGGPPPWGRGKKFALPARLGVVVGAV